MIMGEINSNIRDARKKLRDIYNKYLSELHDINLKIDNYLKTLENESLGRQERE